VYEWESDFEEVQERFSESSYVSIDPGLYGGAISHDGKGEILDVYSLKRTQVPRVNVDLVVMEGQYVGPNARSALRLSFGAGLLCGRIGLDVLIVQPSTWQHVLPAVRGRSELAKATEALARGKLGNVPSFTKKELEGVFSAVGIGEWWRVNRSVA
jgi:hypothetical protein